MIWLTYSLEFVIAVIALTWSANKFVAASSVFARHWGMSSLLVGMIIIGFGTSLPELIVSASAAIHGAPQLAIGNIIGSNIANKALVGGVAALLTPIVIHSKIIKRELPILLIVSLLVAGLLYQGYLSRFSGIILLVLFCLYLAVSFYFSRRDKQDVLLQDIKEYSPKLEKGLLRSSILWLVSLVVLLASSQLIIFSAKGMATLLGASDLVIGLTVVAIGTSLPEMASTIACCSRQDYDMAIGNVVGSSVFNLLPALAMPALISPTPVPNLVLTRDYPIMLVFFLLFWLLAALPSKSGRMGRCSGLLLLVGYASYLVVLSGLV